MLTPRAHDPKMAELWTPSMFQKLFQLVAKSDAGLLGAMGNRDRVVSMGEFVGFMKANSYQSLGLTITDLTDAFKFANKATGRGDGGFIEAEGSVQRLQRGANVDKSEMSEEEFWQCLMFVQARYVALKSTPYVPVLPTRAAFAYNHIGVQQLGRFLQELCGKAIHVRLGAGHTESLQLSKNGGKSEGDAAPPPSKSRRKKSPGGGSAADDENAPLTQVEKARVMSELRSLMVRAQKKRRQNDYIRRVARAQRARVFAARSSFSTPSTTIPYSPPETSSPASARPSPPSPACAKCNTLPHTFPAQTQRAAFFA